MEFDLERFRKAQERSCDNYETALTEIRRGRKNSHWIWYIFPQMKGLGYSYEANFYGISCLEEAKAYAADPVLGSRLREISAALLEHRDKSAYEILGGTDAKKVCSSMTLFERADPACGVYAQVLEQFYRGRRDKKTFELLG